MSAILEKMQKTCDYIVFKALAKSTTVELDVEPMEVVKYLEPELQLEHDEPEMV